MNKYRRIPVEKEKKETPENEIRVTARGRTTTYVSYASKIFNEKGLNDLTVVATGTALATAVTIAEILKRRFKGLHQITKVGSIEITDKYEPLEEGLDEVTDVRSVSFIEVKLSKNALDTKDKGYQPPLPEDQVQEVSAEEMIRGGRRGGGKGGRSPRSSQGTRQKTKGRGKGKSEERGRSGGKSAGKGGKSKSKGKRGQSVGSSPQGKGGKGKGGKGSKGGKAASGGGKGGKGKGKSSKGYDDWGYGGRDDYGYGGGGYDDWGYGGGKGGKGKGGGKSSSKGGKSGGKGKGKGRK